MNFKSVKLKYKSIKLHADVYENSKKESPVIIVAPGTGSYGKYYSEFCEKLSNRGFTVIPFDFMGHGRSGGERGVFSMTELIENISTVISFATGEYNDKIGLLGTSQGGEVAFQAALEDKRVKSVISHNILLPSEFTINFKVKIFKLPICSLIPDFYFPLEKAFDWKNAYNDPTFLEKKRNDPYAVWHYKFQSYRSVFTYKPKKPINEMSAPLLIAVGENDQLVTSEYCKKVYDHLTGKKEFYQMANASHQLLVDYTDKFIPIVENWFRKTLD